MIHIFANWKMYLDFDESCILANQLFQEKFDDSKVNLSIFPNYLAIPELLKIFAQTVVTVGAQNCAWTPRGAYTGAVSANIIKEAGCKYVILGHSERRSIFNETGEDIRKKIEACFDEDLIPVLCIGETEEDGLEGKREYRLKKQIMKSFENLDLSTNDIMLAYEPVWAIGTGNPCNAMDADDVHGWIKLELKNYSDKEIPVLYGGSVTAENVAEYVSRETVDGVLVGGASTKLETLVPLIRAVEKL